MKKEEKMKLAKIISITLFLSICILLFISLGNTAFAGQYVSQQEAENMCPGISGKANIKDMDIHQVIYLELVRNILVCGFVQYVVRKTLIMGYLVLQWML